jgi:3-oxoacyl-[acyl-carrier protein] reductase
MDLGLARKAAIVNGASQGIGYAIAHLLAEEGARVAVTARRTSALDGAAERIRNETGGEVIAVQGDVRNPDDCERIVAEAVAGFGRLDILVNNDGAPPLGAALDFDDAAWLNAIAQNLLSVVRMSRAAVPHIRRAGGGSILNIAALSAKIASALGVTSDYLVDTEESTPVPDVVDQAFFRKYRKLDPNTKAKIRQMVEVWGSEKR